MLPLQTVFVFLAALPVFLTYSCKDICIGGPFYNCEKFWGIGCISLIGETPPESVMVSQCVRTIVWKGRLYRGLKMDRFGKACSTQSTDMEPTGIEPTNTEPTDTEPTDTEPTDMEPTGIEPTNTEPTDTEPTDTEPTDMEPTGIEPTGMEIPDYTVSVLTTMETSTLSTTMATGVKKEIILGLTLWGICATLLFFTLCVAMFIVQRRRSNNRRRLRRLIEMPLMEIPRSPSPLMVRSPESSGISTPSLPPPPPPLRESPVSSRTRSKKFQ